MQLAVFSDETPGHNFELLILLGRVDLIEEFSQLRLGLRVVNHSLLFLFALVFDIQMTLIAVCLKQWLSPLSTIQGIDGRIVQNL